MQNFYSVRYGEEAAWADREEEAGDLGSAVGLCGTLGKSLTLSESPY